MTERLIHTLTLNLRQLYTYFLIFWFDCLFLLLIPFPCYLSLTLAKCSLLTSAPTFVVASRGEPTLSCLIEKQTKKN